MTKEQGIFWKHWVSVLILVAMVTVVLFVLLHFGQIINVVENRLMAYKQQKQREELEKPYKNDQYGGKTPEETFDLFISALKKENTCPAVRNALCGSDLASKYFIISKQEGWERSFTELKRANLFGKMLLEMEYARTNSVKTVEKNTARFLYKSSRGHEAEVIFQKVWKIWKISEL